MLRLELFEVLESGCGMGYIEMVEVLETRIKSSSEVVNGEVIWEWEQEEQHNGEKSTILQCGNVGVDDALLELADEFTTFANLTTELGRVGDQEEG